MRDELTACFEKMITEAASPVKKQSMTAGKVKPGELEGPTKGLGLKGSGPEGAEGTEKAEEAPKDLSPVDKKKKVKESTIMPKSFQELYSEVINEEDLEGASYDDAAGDFPPADGADVPGAEGLEGTEDLEGDKFAAAADLFSQLADLFREMSPAGAVDELPGEETLGDEVAPGGAPVGEAVSEPEPKPFSGNIKQFQAPNKLGISGVKTSKGKANTSAGGKKRTGELEKAPTGVKPGDKSFMKVGGTGPAATGKNASLLEN